MIEAVHLCKRYGAQTAVEDIHFSVSPGEIVGLIGHNGSGKTTTMRMLTGQEKRRRTRSPRRCVSSTSRKCGDG